MLEMDPDKRASAKEMLDHPWLQDLGTDDNVRGHSRSSVQGGHGAQATRLSPPAVKMSSPSMSPEAPAQNVEEDGDAVMKVEGEERESGEEKGEGERDVEDDEEAQDEGQHGGHAALDEEDGDACAAAGGNGDSVVDEVAPGDSDVGNPEEEKVIACEVKVALPLEPAPDGEPPKDSPLTELEGNAPEVRKTAGWGGCLRNLPGIQELKVKGIHRIHASRLARAG